MQFILFSPLLLPSPPVSAGQVTTSKNHRKLHELVPGKFLKNRLIPAEANGTPQTIPGIGNVLVQGWREAQGLHEVPPPANKLVLICCCAGLASDP